MNEYKLVVCGGTFDLFHAGHKAFINDALAQSEKVLLGITGNTYVQSFKNNLDIEDFSVRKKAVEQYLNSIGASEKVQVVEINSAYEPYLETSTDYQAIIVTEQTQRVVKEINVKRQQNNVPQLEIVISPMKKAEDDVLISSTRIRNGEINRDGRLYVNPKWQNKTLILPENLRSILQEPWGEVLKEIPQNINGAKTVVVGDATAQKFNQQKTGQFLSIIDFLIHREIKFHQLSELGFSSQVMQQVKNSPGIVTPELFQAVQSAFNAKEQTVILVEGEDDLAVLPVLLIAPLGFSIFYGQPDEGLVHVLVTEENKEKAYQLAQSFDKS
ncbi:MAG TPA: pantetheine-phosphate adenylyltransferase [Patescibacteria group bacterium]|jgi:cytidyltransferase-like protein|nr:pantetheine-phosphate adenylyltransferase [Patescibacteria group bacterium]